MANSMTARQSAGPHARLWPLWLLWTVFVVYGSLVPLDFHPIPWDLAWHKLRTAPMLNLGIESRADWVANGVLYLPVGFLSAAMLAGRAPGAVHRLLAAGMAMAWGVALALAVEFAQTAFPPRTVSRNDLLAESIGTLLGVVLALPGGGRFRAMLSSYSHGGWTLARRLAPFYVLVYPALALFPFDLLVSAAEWQAKLDGPSVGIALAPSAWALGPVKLVAKLAVETLAALPLGGLWAAWALRRGRVAGQAARAATVVWPAALVGTLVGLLIELAQLAIASGQSQGLSVLTRTLGFALGAAAWQRQDALSAEALRATLRRWTGALLLALLALLTLYNGAFIGPWLAPDQAWQRLLADVHFQPFYYHYYTTEMRALISLLAVSLSYAPLGVLGWAWHVRPGMVALMALLLSLLMEASKLPALGTHPDPSNLWIAAAAAWCAQLLMQRLLSPRIPLMPGSAAARRPAARPGQASRAAHRVQRR